MERQRISVTNRNAFAAQLFGAFKTNSSSAAWPYFDISPSCFVWETSFQARPQNCETDTLAACIWIARSIEEKLIVFEPKQTGGNKRYAGRVGLDKCIQKAGSFLGPCKLRSDKKHQYHEDAASQSNLTNIHPQGRLPNKRRGHKKSGGC